MASQGPLVLVVATVMTDLDSLVTALARVRAEAPGKPVLLVTYGGDRQVDAHRGVTIYDSAGAALQSLAHAASYAAWARGTWPRRDNATIRPRCPASSSDSTMSTIVSPVPISSTSPPLSAAVRTAACASAPHGLLIIRAPAAAANPSGSGG